MLFRKFTTRVPPSPDTRAFTRPPYVTNSPNPTDTDRIHDNTPSTTDRPTSGASTGRRWRELWPQKSGGRYGNTMKPASSQSSLCSGANATAVTNKQEINLALSERWRAGRIVIPRPYCIYPGEFNVHLMIKSLPGCPPDTGRCHSIWLLGGGMCFVSKKKV